ncbi:hypothetical protein HNQ36_001086 [Afipia massiliensis]|uniref:Uncharacterized protein n=1 Tax=Afipia massiliensis TaxID=211460 RepID=A0A840MWP4_9BRAD|nr:hypothetical protein [Afipia massiliensis]MBB5051132.1 hypothetical protein [Afipia massiliensis]
MKSLKCIGGPSDGRRQAVRDGEKSIVVRRYISAPAAADFNSNAPVMESNVKYVDTIYVEDSVHGVDGAIVKYLRPQDWTAAQALRHALS